MHKRHYVAAFRFLFGTLALSAVIFQFIEGSQRLTFSSWNFVSFFTIEANIFAGSLFLFMAIWVLRGHKVDDWYMVRGAATLYMTMTGVIYVLLLAGLEESLQTPTPWVNFVLHYLMPAVVLADWLYDTPRVKLTFRRALPWIIFPVVYVAYSLIRGAATGWYPYPFLNPAQFGYAGVAATSAVIAPAALAFVAVLAWSTRRKAPSKKA